METVAIAWLVSAAANIGTALADRKAASGFLALSTFGLGLVLALSYA